MPWQQCRGKLRELYRSSVYKTQLNGVNPLHVTKCGVCVIISDCMVYCVPHVLYVSVGVVHKKMPYDGVQVCIRTIQVRTQVYKASTSACSCAVRELKIVNKRPMSLQA